MPGRLLALDVGTRTVGLAVSDPERRLVRPLGTLVRRGVKRDADALAATARAEGVVGLVVGLPLDERGAETRSTHLARQLGEALARASHLPLAWMDERFSTVEAARRLRDQGLSERQARSRIDAEAAAVILEDFLASPDAQAFGA
ncbi:MAG: Holliday junction resolvase RuvX [Deltaproteobacteria bacterium]|nr:Holliday junction resolvase RuvX [Deltaproteobacteria bacterium]